MLRCILVFVDDLTDRPSHQHGCSLLQCDSVSPSNASHLGAAFQIKSKSRSYTLVRPLKSKLHCNENVVFIPTQAAATNEKREEWMKAIRKGILIAKHPKSVIPTVRCHRLGQTNTQYWPILEVHALLVLVFSQAGCATSFKFTVLGIS